MKGYVINLISKSIKKDYGYWSGKSYIFQGEYFPIHTDCEITNDTKIFKSKARAGTSAQKCYKRYGYVGEVLIEEVQT